MPLLLQLAMVCAMLAYLWRCCASMHQRNLMSWAHLPALQAVRAGSAVEGFPEIDFLATGISQIHQNAGNLRALWGLFDKARIVLEMADCADLHPAAAEPLIDRTMLVALRKDAMQIRLSALIAMTRCALPNLVS